MFVAVIKLTFFTYGINAPEETVHGSKYARILLAVQYQSQQLELNNNLNNTQINIRRFSQIYSHILRLHTPVVFMAQNVISNKFAAGKSISRAIGRGRGYYVPPRPPPPMQPFVQNK
jgi:hypothetical protein